jgi:hypothetical protein
MFIIMSMFRAFFIAAAAAPFVEFVGILFCALVGNFAGS